jgi:hypothetical protein
MKNFEYEIKLNDDGRPYIHIDDPKLDVSHRFACLELTKYMLYELMKNKEELPEDFLKDLAIAGDMVSGISDKMANIIKGQMDAMSDAEDILNTDTEDE